MRKLCAGVLPLLALIFAIGCGDDNVSSDEDARRAYLGLDKSVSKSLKLAFDGFNAATNANIPDQMTTGDAMPGGTLLISGQVDSGASNNKTMRLNIGMVAYDDGDVKINDNGDTVHIVYDTDMVKTNQPYLEVKLSNYPTGTMDAMLTPNTALTGHYNLSGDIKGYLDLNLTLTGSLMACTAPCITERVVGSTHIVGTATNGDGGTYNIDITI
jgi:hypothetical protein